MASISLGKNYFLKLPPEIRNDIFRLAFVHDAPVPIIIWRDTSPSRQVRGISPQPSLSATCKQFRTEVLLIYYAENSFYLSPDLYSSKDSHRSRLAWFESWALAAKEFDRFLTSIKFVQYYRHFSVLKCTDDVEEREGGTTKFKPHQVCLTATRAPSSNGHGGRLEFKLTMSGNFVEDSGEGFADIQPGTYRHCEGIAMCVCDSGLASSGHQDETLHSRGNVKDFGLLNGTLQAVSTILEARSVEICCSCHLLMLRT